jgi:hypothetical protein
MKTHQEIMGKWCDEHPEKLSLHEDLMRIARESDKREAEAFAEKEKAFEEFKTKELDNSAKNIT